MCFFPRDTAPFKKQTPSVFERELEAQSASRVVFHADGSAMHAHGVFHDGESEAGAAHLAAPALVHAIETFKEAREVVVGHAHAVVAEREAPAALAATCLEADVGIVSGIGNGIVGEIAEDAVNQASVAMAQGRTCSPAPRCVLSPPRRSCRRSSSRRHRRDG